MKNTNTVDTIISNIISKVDTSSRGIIMKDKDTEYNVAGLIREAKHTEGKVTLYGVNILSGKGNVKHTVNCNLHGCNPDEVADTIEALWYKRMSAEIASMFAGIEEVKREDLSEENATRYDYLMGWTTTDTHYDGRKAELEEALKVHTEKEAENPVGLAIFHSLVKVEPKDYDTDTEKKPIKTAFDKLVDEVKALYDRKGKEEFSSITLPVNGLKEALTAFGKLVAGDKFRANYTYTRDTYSTLFKCYGFDKEGEAKRMYVKPNEMIASTVTMCIHFMREKAKAEAEEAKKPEAKKPEAEAK